MDMIRLKGNLNIQNLKPKTDKYHPTTDEILLFEATINAFDYIRLTNWNYFIWYS